MYKFYKSIINQKIYVPIEKINNTIFKSFFNYLLSQGVFALATAVQLLFIDLEIFFDDKK